MRANNTFFLLLLPLLLFLSFNKHSKDELGTYHSVFWADSAGYYVYLPLTFIYEGDPTEFPKNIEDHTGNGFDLRKEEGTVFTKYMLGPAILQMPFFLSAHSLASPLGYEANGFSWIYHAGIMVAGVFYTWLACWLLFSFLKKHFFSTYNSCLLILLLLFGSHLYYYTIATPGMSHLYSFFLFALLIHSWGALHRDPSRGMAMILGACTGLIILCRPTNLIFLSFPFFISFTGQWELKERFKWIQEHKKLVSLIFITLLISLIPQMAYWEWLTDSPVYYSYQNEGFSNWDTPQIQKVLFSTKNGLIPYTPLYILILAGIGKLLYDKDRNGWGFLFLFVLLTYIVSSWWTWYFGCAFGARNYVEYLAPFSIPLGHILFRTRSKGLRLLFAGLALLFIYANLDLVYYYDGCFYGGVWDWETYWGFYG